MLFKLSLRNIKRSFRDYWVYFLTLVFSVSMFYTFNSIESQKIMMSLDGNKKMMLEALKISIGIFSWVISIVIAFLIIYANKFLIRRRKKEFGIYMTLGMNKRSISSLLFIETILIGVISLIVGILLGGVLSQGLAMLTANIFKVQINEFKFIFSNEAFFKTLICFGVIYFLVMIFNSISIGKIKLINLINANKKNEKILNKNTFLNIILFFVSIIFIGIGYEKILSLGASAVDGRIVVAILFVGAGTFLMFYALSGIVLKIFMKNKKMYFKNINMFTLRQISSKINSTFVSMGFVCLMLFFSICILGAGFGVAQGVNNDLTDLTKFEASIRTYSKDDDLKHKDTINRILQKNNIQKINFKYYETDIGVRDFLGEDAVNDNNSYVPLKRNEKLKAMKLSDYNKIQKELNGEEIKLKNDEYAVFFDSTVLKDALKEKYNNAESLNIFGKKLHKIQNGLKKDNIECIPYKRNDATFIVPDELLENIKESSSIINILKNQDIDNSIEEISKYINSEMDKGLKFDLSISTREKVESKITGTSLITSYIGIYVGIIFLVVSAAILAIQQLTETGDNLERYNLLRKIGVSEGLIKRAIITQISIYFMLPFGVALIHSIPGFKISKDIINTMGSGDVRLFANVGFLLVILVFGAYYVSTIIGALKMYKCKDE